MGGTSTDVSRFADGKYEHVVESTTAGVTIQAPQLDINTVAAGGGSMLFFRKRTQSYFNHIEFSLKFLKQTFIFQGLVCLSWVLSRLVNIFSR